MLLERKWDWLKNNLALAIGKLVLILRLGLSSKVGKTPSSGRKVDQLAIIKTKLRSDPWGSSIRTFRGT